MARPIPDPFDDRIVPPGGRLSSRVGDWRDRHPVIVGAIITSTLTLATVLTLQGLPT